MALDFHQISSQVKKMAHTVATRAAEKNDLLATARKLLHTHATNFDFLHGQVAAAEKASEGVRFNWLGAAPTTEPLDATFPAPSAPHAIATILASDGSQIQPDRHAIALYYLVNVGIIVYRHGTNSTPDVHSEARLFFEDDDLLTEQGLLVPGSIVNAKRDVAEVEILARFAPAYAADGTVIALMDGQLSLHIMELSGKEQAQYQKEYLTHLDALRAHGATVAAYIDRPRSGFVLSLLHLATLSDNITEATLRHNPFIRLTDALLFDNLPAGHRTTVFRQRSKANADYAKAGHAIHFFYLNTGSPEMPNIVRVEIPEWVATDPERLNTLHAMLLKQAAISGGYPYVLARAHELAIIPPDQREALDTMLAVSLRKAGVHHIGVSLKQANKNALWGM